ncbi:hypothetical protein [Marinobacter changyiensis]|nr:hypothetical protein [Marinobacter changyiensis]
MQFINAPADHSVQFQQLVNGHVFNDMARQINPLLVVKLNTVVNLLNA